MSISHALRLLAEVASSQWGMVTTAQAAEYGVQRLDLSRLAKSGHLERLTHGVYRYAGSPSEEFENLRAAWLATEPSLMAERRLSDLANAVVVMGASAASLHGVGDLPAARYEFSSPVRRQSQRPGISYRQRELSPIDVTIAHGLPVTTVERTIVDLVEARTDLSLVADVLRDAARIRSLDAHRLVELLRPLAGRNGLRKDDGEALLDQLIVLAGLDSETLANQLAASEALADLVAARRLANLTSDGFATKTVGPQTQTAIRSLTKSIAGAVKEAILLEQRNFDESSTGLQSLGEAKSTLCRVVEQASIGLPMQELLGSFGQEWMTALKTAATGSGDGTLPAVEVVKAASGLGLVSAHD
ncbi:MAG: type IV toxin-antitoxin system AbiEi family antitoxin domain-containing protein [Microthrixaceae bacterium]|nr:type IV toxin-antitoxin system AbiEi family antitoxin domain-containing protein [Microthrixaceae bacterium]